MNKRYYEIFKIKIDNFITEMNQSKSIYEDLSKKNKLIHPAEYGMYKERTLKELTKFILPVKYEITDGYVINSFDETSTQCDLILYDKINTPLIEYGDRFQFIPAESVVAIGEVKSVLTKNDFIKTAIKLAKNKKLCKPSEHYCEINNGYNEELFAPFSFIICDYITGINDNFTFKDLIKELAEEYRKEGLNVNNYFNIIISIEDKKAFSYKTPKEYIKGDITIPINTKIFYPKRFGDIMNGSIVGCANHYTLFRELASSLTSSLEMRPQYFADPREYLW